jgi:hypothetical protein
MTAADIPEPLNHFLKVFFNVEVLGPGWHDRIHRAFAIDPVKASAFRRQFADLIHKNEITPAVYEQLTHHTLDSREELTDWLYHMWKEIYGDEPIPEE